MKLEKRYKGFSYSVGSTALVGIMYKKNKSLKAYILNTGDCRAILCNSNNIAIALTKDHKPNYIEEKKRINNLGGEIEFDGYDWRIKGLSVSRAFGDMDIMPYVTHKPEIFNYSINKNDKFLVFACDGLWDALSNQDVADFILKQMSKNNHLINMYGNSSKNIAYELGKYAIKKGSLDNISIIIVFLRN
tara:strand:- start:309 stop:875 length:567 start_codon:yes stop_codon:yes gene_type:complete